MGAKQEKIKTTQERMLTIFKLSVFLLLHFTKMQVSKMVNFKKCTTCEKGDWGFPQNVKSQKSVCRVPANWLIDLFIFASVRTLANLASMKVGQVIGEGKILLF